LSNWSTRVLEVAVKLAAADSQRPTQSDGLWVSPQRLPSRCDDARGWPTRKAASSSTSILPS